jgi:hypothetical protein
MAKGKEVVDLPKGLPTRDDDDVAVRVFIGRALSKSATSLHLAVRTGIIAVPLKSIARVLPVRGVKNMVRIVVRNPAGVRPLLDVKPVSSASESSDDKPRRGEFIGTTLEGVATCSSYDTPTVTSEEGDDASDDTDSDCPADDLE